MGFTFFYGEGFLKLEHARKKISEFFVVPRRRVHWPQKTRGFEIKIQTQIRIQPGIQLPLAIQRFDMVSQQRKQQGQWGDYVQIYVLERKLKKKFMEINKNLKTNFK